MSFFLFFCEIPPKAIISFFVSFEIKLNLFIPKKFLFSLNKEDKKIFSTFCFSLILISLRLCADPTILKFFLKEYAKCCVLLLKDGMYTPSKSSLIAS